ncbi:hypothetical protein [Spirochaeta cellobiosiphila]|uniref:hypothetical protein n=1 Tax=Spirochaeta cellobiosiphila TaxID=504483 RepID=UPI00069D6F3F|nr:hypothetical protein [Spirochaeta cellobiosiphila]
MFYVLLLIFISYIELAEISCEDTDDNWAMDQILMKSKEIGADGIIIIGKAATYGYGISIGDMLFTSFEAYGIKAIAIKYTTD